MTNTYGIDPGGGTPALETRNLTVSRDSRTVVKPLSMVLPSNRVVGFVGPSGCGKTTLLKSFNRMNDLDPEIQVGGEVLLHGRSIYESDVEVAEVRRRVGMVFQNPTPFPTSVYQNVAFGPKVNRYDGDLDRLVEDSLRKAALWEEVSDRLHESALRLSAGQQQRLCIARALAVGPDVLLMDEPASDLDPGATQRVEELIHSLKEDYTIVLVTHNMQQAARVSDFTAFFYKGEMVEYGPTSAIFTNPREERTEAYLTGRLA
ncbi:MAG: phosphate ABC transporter ATP-binding protein PstB [Longimicrobiales bacterium]